MRIRNINKKDGNKRIYQSVTTDRSENLRQDDARKKRLLVRIESPADYPNYGTAIYRVSKGYIMNK